MSWLITTKKACEKNRAAGYSTRRKNTGTNLPNALAALWQRRKDRQVDETMPRTRPTATICKISIWKYKRKGLYIYFAMPTDTKLRRARGIIFFPDIRGQRVKQQPQVPLPSILKVMVLVLSLPTQIPVAVVMITIVMVMLMVMMMTMAMTMLMKILLLITTVIN